MLMPLDEIVERCQVRPGPTLHVGACLGEEAPDYARLGFAPVWFIEGNPKIINQLILNVQQYPENHAVSAVLAEREREATLNIASNLQSSSILPLGTHAVEHPDVAYVDGIDCRTTTVDRLHNDGVIGQATFLNIDVQGAELLVLRGAEKYLQKVDAIYAEVNDKELYESCVLFPELNAWLESLGFSFVERLMTRHGWGDALWKKAC